MNKNIALRGIFFLGMPGRKGFPFRATNKYIWYTVVREVATMIKADLLCFPAAPAPHRFFSRNSLRRICETDYV